MTPTTYGSYVILNPTPPLPVIVDLIATPRFDTALKVLEEYSHDRCIPDLELHEVHPVAYLAASGAPLNTGPYRVYLLKAIEAHKANQPPPRPPVVEVSKPSKGARVKVRLGRYEAGLTTWARVLHPELDPRVTGGRVWRRMIAKKWDPWDALVLPPGRQRKPKAPIERTRDPILDLAQSGRWV